MRFPHSKQADSKFCGVACLVSICKFYGKSYSSAFLASLCHIGSEGMSLLGLSNVARKLGFDTMCISIPHAKLEHCPLPAILHWNQNHFVVLYKIDHKRRYQISDPAKGRIKLSEDEFFKHWLGESDKGIALLLEPTAEFGKIEPKQDSSLKTLKLVTDYIKRYRSYLVQVVLSLCFASVLQLIFPFLTQKLVDVGIGEKRISFIWLILLGELFLIIGRVLSEFIRRWLMLHVTMRVNVTLVSDFFIKLLKLPMAFFEMRTMGDLNQRMNDHSRVQSFLTNQCLNSIFAISTLVVFSVVLCLYSRILFGIFLLGSILYAGWIVLFLKKRKLIDYDLFDIQAKNQSKMYEFLSSMQEIKLQNCRQRRRWEWEDLQADLFEVQQKSLKLQQTQEAGSVLINEIKNIFITIVSATFVINGEITLGGMMAIQYIVGQLSNPVEQMVSFAYSFQDMKIALERINEVHNSVNEEDIQSGKSTLEKNSDITISDLNFKYDPDSPRYTLEKINVAIPTNKVTAIVGHSGSGKTTLLKLLLGYYTTYEGEIAVNGESLRNFDIDWWREQCGVAMQDGVIFTESIARNIAVDDKDIDWDRIRIAARVANILEDIEALPLGFQTIIGKEGHGMSQGQKQRILIARAVYRNPSYIFLDEATNSLDAKNERTIVENLSEFYAGKTVVVVAHRLSTVKHADQIIVLDKGSIVEKGTHEELVCRRGAYYSLVNNQLELAK